MPSPDRIAYFFAAYGSVWWTFSVWHATFVMFKGSGVTAFSILCRGGAAGYALFSYPGWRANGVLGIGAPPPTPSWNAARVLAIPPLAVAFAGTVLMSVSHGIDNAVLSDLWSHFTLNWPAFTAMFALGTLSHRSSIPTRLRLVTWGISLFAFISYTAIVWQIWANKLLPQTQSVMRGPGYLAGFLPLFAATALLTMKRFDRTVAMRAYLKSSCAVLCLMMLIRFPTFIDSFRVAMIPPFYIPLLNTLELRQFLYAAAAAMLINVLPNERIQKIGLHYVMTFVTFLLLNNVAARSALYYFDEHVSWGYMSRAPYFQGIIAIIWGLASLAYIFCGKRYGSRPLWFIGAGLLALDILKLLMIDLRNSATIIRIFVFLLLGGFFLLVGWAAPLPPAAVSRDKREEEEA
jgi:uncharacterized membrane protein